MATNNNRSEVTMEFDDETVINSTTPLNVPLKKSRRPNLSMNSIEPDVGNGSLRTGLGIQGRKQKQPQQEESRKFTRRAKSLSSNFGDGGKVPPPCRSSNSIACNVARSNISTHEHESKDDCKTCRKSFSNEEKLQIELTLPIFLKFEDVRYKIAAKSRRETGKYILHGVTGSVNPGKVLTLMGPSGGGKTTLLNLLSGRENVANHGGRVTYNDQPFTKSLKRRIGFVLQDDVVFPQLTVKETLTYAVLLRLPKTLPKKQKEECAMSVIGVLGLRGGAVVLHIGVLGFLSGVHRNLHVPTSEAMLAKERSVGMYKLSAYFVARNTSDLPLDLILPIAFLLIVYSMVGLKRNVFVFFQSMLTVFLSITAAQDLGLAIGAAFMDLKKATTMASVVVMTFMLAGGFFVQRVPSFMAWIRYLSFNYHTYRL